MDDSTGPPGRRTLPFAPLAQAIDDATRYRGRAVSDVLDDNERRAYHRAHVSGRITLDRADTFCERYGWHPREIWTNGEWDHLAEIEAATQTAGNGRGHPPVRPRHPTCTPADDSRTGRSTMTDGAAFLLRGDALHLPLADATVDLVCTSPPYLWKRKYAIDGPGELGNEATWPEFLDNLWTVTDELVRVLKPTGSIWVQLGDTRVTGTEPKWCGIPVKSKLLIPERYRIGCQDRYAAQGVIVRQVQIHEKANGLPESVDDRTRDSHEDWVHIVKRRDYYSAVDEIREAASGYQRANGANRHTPNGQRQRAMADTCNPLGALPGSVWRLSSEPLIIPPAIAQALNLPSHYAAFCTEVVRRILLGWSPTGICCECGQGRAPVVDRQKVQVRAPYSGGSARRDAQEPNGNSRGMNDRSEGCFATEATILGYACACTPYTDHPGTGGTRRRDYQAMPDARPQGTYGRHQAGEYEPVSPWREYHLDGWTPPPTRPAVVLDCFGGTGTVAGVARQLGRLGVSVDLSADYCRLAKWRIWESGHFAKTEARTWLERQGALL